MLIRDDIIIREAKLDDVMAISSFNIQMAKETEGKKIVKEIVIKGVQAIIKDPQKGFYLVAEKGNKILGQLLITFEWSDWRNKFFWWLQSVYVDTKYRNQLIFSSLYEYVLKMAKYRQDVFGLRLYVEKNNKIAQEVYTALGMKKTTYNIYQISFE